MKLVKFYQLPQGIVRFLLVKTGLSSTPVWMAAKWMDVWLKDRGLIGWNPDEDPLRYLASFLKPGMNVVDLGANLGSYTVPMANLIGPRGHVFAFEANPDIYARLKSTLEQQKIQNVTLINAAVADKSATVPFYVNTIDHKASSLHRHPGTREIRVPMIFLDEFFEKKKWPPISFIKMDIEGAEAAAVRGARTLIKKNEGIRLFMEFSPYCFRDDGEDNAEYIFGLLQELQLTDMYVIGRTLRPINIPADIPQLERLVAYQVQNILCKSPDASLL